MDGTLRSVFTAQPGDRRTCWEGPEGWRQELKWRFIRIAVRQLWAVLNRYLSPARGDTVRVMWGRRKSGVMPSDDDFLRLIRDRIRVIEPAVVAGSQIKDGLMTGSPGWTVMMLPNQHDPDDGHARRHLDIAFIPDIRSSGDNGAAIDC